MFSCIFHGWSHIEKPCPICIPYYHSTYDTNELYITVPAKEAMSMKCIDKNVYDRVFQLITECSKRSSYQWSSLGVYTEADWQFEGKISLANELLAILNGSKS